MAVSVPKSAHCLKVQTQRPHRGTCICQRSAFTSRPCGSLVLSFSRFFAVEILLRVGNNHGAAEGD
jgi:hypothetical protein